MQTNKIDLTNRVAIVTGARGASAMQSGAPVAVRGGRIDVWDAAALRSTGRIARRMQLVSAGGLVAYGLTITFASFDWLMSIEPHWFSTIYGVLIIGGPVAPIWEYDLTAFRQVFDVNVVGVFLCCKTVVPLMRKNNYGRIVNIASIAGKNGTPTFAAYGASKAAVIALTKALGRELADTEILANAVCPSIADTDILQQHSPEKIKELVALVPKGRFVRTDEIAAMVAWLSSEECSFSTGQLFDITAAGHCVLRSTG